MPFTSDSGTTMGNSYHDDIPMNGASHCIHDMLHICKIYNLQNILLVQTTMALVLDIRIQKHCILPVTAICA